LDWEETASYCVSLWAWMTGIFSRNCEEWAHLFAFLTIFVTFVCITLPKAYDFQKKRYQQKKKNEKDT